MVQKTVSGNWDEDKIYEYEKWLSRLAFSRTVTRKAKLKKWLDCGHVIDGTEPYRYMVWKWNSDPRGVIHQRTDCEFCARRDNRY